MHVPHDSVVLVTDGCKRLFLRNDGDALAPHLTVILAAEDANPKTRDQVTSQGIAGQRLDQHRAIVTRQQCIGSTAESGCFQDCVHAKEHTAMLYVPQWCYAGRHRWLMAARCGTAAGDGGAGHGVGPQAARRRGLAVGLVACPNPPC